MRLFEMFLQPVVIGKVIQSRLASLFLANVALFVLIPHVFIQLIARVVPLFAVLAILMISLHVRCERVARVERMFMSEYLLVLDALIAELLVVISPDVRLEILPAGTGRFAYWVWAVEVKKK